VNTEMINIRFATDGAKSISLKFNDDRSSYYSTES